MNKRICDIVPLIEHHRVEIDKISPLAKSKRLDVFYVALSDSSSEDLDFCEPFPNNNEQKVTFS